MQQLTLIGIGIDGDTICVSRKVRRQSGRTSTKLAFSLAGSVLIWILAVVCLLVGTAVGTWKALPRRGLRSAVVGIRTANTKFGRVEEWTVTSYLLGTPLREIVNIAKASLALSPKNVFVLDEAISAEERFSLLKGFELSYVWRIFEINDDRQLATRGKHNIFFEDGQLPWIPLLVDGLVSKVRDGRNAQRLSGDYTNREFVIGDLRWRVPVDLKSDADTRHAGVLFRRLQSANWIRYTVDENPSSRTVFVGSGLSPDSADCEKQDCSLSRSDPNKIFCELGELPLYLYVLASIPCGVIILIGSYLIVDRYTLGRSLWAGLLVGIGVAGLASIGGSIALGDPRVTWGLRDAKTCEDYDENRSENRQTFQHSGEIVQQKLLTLSSFRYTVITSRVGHGERSSLRPSLPKPQSKPPSCRRSEVPETKPKPKKVGRPKLPKGEAKGKLVALRLSASDVKRVSAAAKAKKQTVSEWIRSTLEASLNG